MKVLDKGFVELKDYLASDIGVVAAARVSNGISYEDASKGIESDAKLINYLIKHKHGTPFEHNLFTFDVKVPLFVRSEWHRHRIGWSYNEVSRRYVDTPPDFYIPELWRRQSSNNKQGSDGLFDQDTNEQFSKELQLITDTSLEVYEWLLRRNVAKEMARMTLPQNMYTEFYASCNARSLMHFLNLRNHQNAQWEIRQYAIALEETFRDKMPITYSAWIENERVAP